MVATPFSDWTRIVVPQTAAHPLHHPIERIYFDSIGHQGEGIPLTYLSALVRRGHNIRQLIDGAEDPVLDNVDKVEFYIRWPGYEQVRWETKIERGTPGWGTARWNFAYFILVNFEAFMLRQRVEKRQPIGNMCWRLGPDGIKLSHLVLLSAVRVFEDSWRAEVEVRIPNSKIHRYQKDVKALM
ncbi:hypothetical protein L218DRAFT_1008475 [Marasmius fiardii PR-910]|nr:hypothetical protein L218DRAFT_1008475 [Marasmius fiardii PR-910]